MNGPSKIYKLKPIIRHDFEINLPECMYKMKNIHSKITTTRNINGIMVEEQSSDHVSKSNKNLDIYDKVKQFLKNNGNLNGMAEIEARQEEILKQLAELRKQMDSIRQNLKIIQPITTSNNQTTNTALTPVEISNLPSILVVNVNPTNPPYSLIILQKLIQNQLYLKVETTTHSTVNQLSDEVKNLETILSNFRPIREVPKLVIKLIWKNVEDDFCEFLVSYSPIFGEVNLLRYLVRLTTHHLNYELNQLDCFEIDQLLDHSFRILQSKTKTERISLLQFLSKSLGKSAKWLAGKNDISLADIANYSAIKQNVASNEINVNLTKWFQRCEEVVYG